MTNPTWLRRNRLWLLMLAPLLLLAVATSSFRLVTLYLPWEWSRPTVAHAPTGTLRHQFLGSDDVRREREVTVTIVSARSVPSSDGILPAPGAALWQIELEFVASPDQILQFCTIELADAAGTRYGNQGGKVDADGEPTFANALQFCVPEDAPGPTLESFTGQLVPSPEERPATWRLTYALGLPSDAEPTELRIGWDRPEYLVLQLP